MRLPRPAGQNLILPLKRRHPRAGIFVFEHRVVAAVFFRNARNDHTAVAGADSSGRRGADAKGRSRLSLRHVSLGKTVPDAVFDGRRSDGHAFHGDITLFLPDELIEGKRRADDQE